MVKRSSSVGVSSIDHTLSVNEQAKIGARVPRRSDLKKWDEARKSGIVRHRLSNQRIDQGQASAQDLLTLQSADRAKPHRSGRDARGDAVGGSELRQFFVETHRPPDGSLHDGNVAKADTRADGIAQPQRRGIAEPCMRRQKRSAVTSRAVAYRATERRCFHV